MRDKPTHYYKIINHTDMGKDFLDCVTDRNRDLVDSRVKNLINNGTISFNNVGDLVISNTDSTESIVVGLLQEYDYTIDYEYIDVIKLEIGIDSETMKAFETLSFLARYKQQ